MEEKKKLPGEGENGRRIKTYIHVLRGLINYHNRMTLPHKNNKLSCYPAEGCPILCYEDDVYLATLEASLRLMEREEKKKLPGEGEKRKLESAITVLDSIRMMFSSGVSIDEQLKNSIALDDEVQEPDKLVRAVFAEHISYAISVLEDLI